MDAIGYVFQSTYESEIPDGDVQEVALKYARQLGMDIQYYCYEQGASLRKPFHERPAGGKLFDNLQHGNVVITGKAEWVLCSAKEGGKLLNQLEKKGVALYCLDLDANISLPQERKLIVSDGQAGFAKKLLKSLAACESSKHGEAIRAAKREMLKEGKYVGGPIPFGWRVKNGSLTKDKEQQRIIRQIKKWRSDRWSYRDISVKLRDSFGIKLSHEGVRKVLIGDEARQR
jgi:DNA invertase Pin-like site-specific DNA recombinase